VFRGGVGSGGTGGRFRPELGANDRDLAVGAGAEHEPDRGDADGAERQHSSKSGIHVYEV